MAGSGVAVGSAAPAELGTGEAAGTGVDVSIGVAVGVEVGVGVDVGFGVGVGVGVTVGIGVAVEVGETMAPMPAAGELEADAVSPGDGLSAGLILRGASLPVIA